MIDERQLITELEIEIGETYNSDIGYGLKRAIEIVEHRPLVGKWIPCSKRLPGDTAIHEVTAQFRNGTIYTEFAYYDETREEWWRFDDDDTVNVIAWKEHSEPYKGE